MYYGPSFIVLAPENGNGKLFESPLLTPLLLSVLWDIASIILSF